MKTLLLLVLLFGSYSASAQPGWQWVNQLTSSAAAVTAKSITTDAAGNSYVTGSFQGTLQLEGRSLSSRGATDLFLVKYSPTGKVMWVSQLGPVSGMPTPYPAEASGTDVALDAVGNVYVVGNFSGTLAYGNARTVSSFSEGFTTALLAKFGPTGQVQWVERFGIPQFSCYGYAIATDAAGNSYVTGQADYGGIRFGSQVVGGSRRVMYVARYTTTGAVAWAKVSSNYSSYGASGADVALDGRGNCLVGGFFNNDLTLEGQTLTTSGADAYLASFQAASGGLQWLRQGSAPGADKAVYISSLATDAQGNIYAAGSYSGTVVFGGQQLTSSGSSDQFLARYTRTGALQWVESVGTSAPEYTTCLTTTPAGYSTLVGRRLNTTYQPTTLLHCLQPDGGVYHTETVGTSGSCTASSIAQDQAGKLYVAGTLSGTASFGRTTLQTGARTDGFVARLSVPPPGMQGTGPGRPAFQVYPNPTQGRLTALLLWPKPGMLTTGKALLYNSLGSPVLTQPLFATGVTQVQATFDCSSLLPGIYTLKLFTPDGTTYTQGVEVQ